MNLDELLNEKIKKVHGKWALVSKSNPDKVLQYYHGKDHPSKEWEKKVERRIHAFSHMNEADINKTIDDIRQNVHADELEGLKRYSNAQLVDWLKRLTAKNKSVIGPAMATADALGPLAKPFARTFVQRQYPTVDNDEFEQMWGVWNRMDDETRSAIKAGDLSTLDPRDEHGFIKETDDEKPSLAQQINFGGAYDDKGSSWTDTVKGWFGSNNNTQAPPASSRPQLQPKRVREADEDYDTWKQRAIERAKRQAEKRRAELQQATARVQQDPEKIELQKTIQSARAELNKRRREEQEKLAKLTAKFEAMSDSELDQLISATWASQRNSQFYKFLKSVKAERAEAKQAKQDLLRSVAGNVQGKQTQKTAPAQDAPWTQMGIDRKSFRKILNNPQHPKHREARSLHAQYKPVAEDLTRRDFLKGVGAVGALGLASGAAKAFGLKDPTKSTDPQELYKRFTGVSQSPLHADPALNTSREWNRVGVEQRGNQFSIVLHKDFGLYLYFDVEYFAESPYVYIELKNGKRYKFRKRTLKSDIFTVEDDRLAALLLNYIGEFTVEVDKDVYTFNITSSPDAQRLYKWWKEGDYK